LLFETGLGIVVNPQVDFCADGTATSVTRAHGTRHPGSTRSKKVRMSIMPRTTRPIVLAGCIIALAACGKESTAPTALLAPKVSNAWGPETPPFNLEVVLRGDGFGLVKFRQPNDAALIIHLDTWVRGLEPNTAYVLQRAVDTNLDGICSSTSWLTLGKGLVPQTITTDAQGTGRESLFRNVGAAGVGATFDITFRVVNVATSAVVFTSDCYRYTISQ
jgi:hypothetical protein